VKLKTKGNAKSIQSIGLGMIVASIVAGCGGGGDGAAPVANTPAPAPAPAATILKGVVAVGAAVSGATVVIKDADGATADVTATAGTDGSYQADVSSLKAPFVVSATGTLNGEPVSIVAVVPSVSTSTSNTANVTSLTTAVAALCAPGGDLSALNTPSSLSAAATTAKVSDATALVVNTLRTDNEIAASLGANFNPLTTAFTADSTGIDSVLDRLTVEVASGGVSINNNTAPIAADGSKPPATVLTAAQTATPNTAPVLAASAASGSLPTTAELTVLAKKFEACLAQPISQRVTLNASGTVTAVSPACNYTPAGWSSNGRNFLEEVGQFTLTRDQLTNAKAGVPIINAVFAARGLTGPTEYKHAVCNTATCVEMLIPFTSASGQPISSGWVVGKVNGVWDYVGNRRPHRMFVEQRLVRKNAVNTALAITNPTNFFLKDRYEASIRVIFDLSVGNTANIKAVRWTGPGLPAAGLVTYRSQRCGTDDRMGIANQYGLLTVNNSAATQLWTNASGVEFFLSAADLAGAPLVRPAPTGWAAVASPINQDQAASDFTGSIPAQAEYKAEIFYFTNTTNVADEIVYTRTGSAYEPASVGPTKAWPTLAPSFIDAYLKPTGSSAGSISSLAQTMNWTNPAGNYVASSYLFAQNTISSVNSELDPATNYVSRTRMDFRPTAYGDSSGTGQEFANIASGASLSPSSSSASTNPNPRCTSTDLIELTTINGAYREVGLTFRGADRKFYNAITFWSN
jgi:hypothetical protein